MLKKVLLQYSGRFLCIFYSNTCRNVDRCLDGEKQVKPWSGSQYTNCFLCEFFPTPGKNDLHISRSYSVSHVILPKLRKKTNLGKKTLIGHWEGCFLAVFWQTGCDSGVFLTCSQSDGFPGFSGYLMMGCMANRARFGRISRCRRYEKDR